MAKKIFLSLCQQASTTYLSIENLFITLKIYEVIMDCIIYFFLYFFELVKSRFIYNFLFCIRPQSNSRLNCFLLTQSLGTVKSEIFSILTFLIIFVHTKYSWAYSYACTIRYSYIHVCTSMLKYMGIWVVLHTYMPHDK